MLQQPPALLWVGLEACPEGLGEASAQAALCRRTTVVWQWEWSTARVRKHSCWPVAGAPEGNASLGIITCRLIALSPFTTALRVHLSLRSPRPPTQHPPGRVHRRDGHRALVAWVVRWPVLSRLPPWVCLPAFRRCSPATPPWVCLPAPRRCSPAGRCPCHPTLCVPACPQVLLYNLASVRKGVPPPRLLPFIPKDSVEATYKQVCACVCVFWAACRRCKQACGWVGWGWGVEGQHVRTCVLACQPFCNERAADEVLWGGGHQCPSV